MGTGTTSSKYVLENEYYCLEMKNGIAFAEYKPGLNILYEDACKIVSDRLNCLGDISFPVLIKSTKILTIEKEAKKHLFTEGMKNFKAMAFVENSLLEKMIAQAFLKLQPINIPHRTFLNEEKAVQWLQQYL